MCVTDTRHNEGTPKAGCTAHRPGGLSSRQGNTHPPQRSPKRLHHRRRESGSGKNPSKTSLERSARSHRKPQPTVRRTIHRARSTGTVTKQDLLSCNEPRALARADSVGAGSLSLVCHRSLADQCLSPTRVLARAIASYSIHAFAAQKQ